MFIFFIFMNSYHEIPISPNNIQPSAPPQYYDDPTRQSIMNNYNYSYSSYTNQNTNPIPIPIIIHNPNWEQEIEDNQTTFVEKKCLFFIFLGGFIIYLIYYLCKDA